MLIPVVGLESHLKRADEEELRRIDSKSRPIGFERCHAYDHAMIARRRSAELWNAKRHIFDGPIGSQAEYAFASACVPFDDGWGLSGAAPQDCLPDLIGTRFGSRDSGTDHDSSTPLIRLVGHEECSV